MLDADLLAAETEGEAEAAGPATRPSTSPRPCRAPKRSRARALGLVALLAERHRSLHRAITATVDHDVIAALEAETASLHERLAGADDEAGVLRPLVDDLAAAEAELARDTGAFDEEWSTRSRAGR